MSVDLESLIVGEIEELGRSTEPSKSILCRRAIENFFRLPKETTPRRLRERVLKVIHDHDHDIHFKGKARNLQIDIQYTDYRLCSADAAFRASGRPHQGTPAERAIVRSAAKRSDSRYTGICARECQCLQ